MNAQRRPRGCLPWRLASWKPPRTSTFRRARSNSSGGSKAAPAMGLLPDIEHLVDRAQGVDLEFIIAVRPADEHLDVVLGPDEGIALGQPGLDIGLFDPVADVEGFVVPERGHARFEQGRGAGDQVDEARGALRPDPAFVIESPVDRGGPGRRAGRCRWRDRIRAAVALGHLVILFLVSLYSIMALFSTLAIVREPGQRAGGRGSPARNRLGPRWRGRACGRFRTSPAPNRAWPPGPQPRSRSFRCKARRMC